MTTLTSADGTAIAFDRTGDGPPVILVAGALGNRFADAQLAELLAPQFEAAIRGLGIGKLALWEPNFLVDDSRPPLPDDYVEHVNELVAAGRRGGAVEYFMTTAVGMPAEFVAPMRELPMWPGMELAAHTLAYDGTVVAGFALDAARLGSLRTPTLVLDGGQVPWMSNGARAVAEALPQAQHRTLDGQPHNVAADAVAPALREFFAA
jgi:pimeloyl-ACP methyl ester carboxylesterase